jgi:ketosteroid isomerase-like protein
MTMPANKTFFATPQDAEAAFYEAIERADLESLMAVWCDEEEVVYVSPGGPRISGYASVREAWQAVFEGGARLHFRIHTLSAVVNPFTAIHSVVETITIEGQEDNLTPVVATNIFLKGPLGWRLVLHHASPSPPESATYAQILH